jgi:hypothetical protein
VAAPPTADSRRVQISGEIRRHISGEIRRHKGIITASAPFTTSQFHSDCGHHNDSLSIHVSADVAGVRDTSRVSEFAVVIELQATAFAEIR